MKNIHLLPTKKPSRLYYKDDNYKLANSTMAIDWYISSAGYKPTNIYITSDEEIKEGDWYYWIVTNMRIKAIRDNLGRLPKFSDGSRKIILTTDSTLIADGVQSIDDEFLEWFVKNPSCEKVEVEHFGTCCGNQSITQCINCKKYNPVYKIIIPQEEPKQETLEEAAANLADPNICKTDNWIAGAKWQAERVYSEEAVNEMFDTLKRNSIDNIATISNVHLFIDSWKKQFKKK